MLLGFVIIVAGMAALMLLERIYPDQKLKRVKGWWLSVVLINLYQLTVVVVGMYTWEKWLRVPTLLNLGEYLSPAVGGLVAYLINTWIFYWWHLARHKIYFLWILCHQMHHSAQRIEAITSFYKHPMEILLDSVMMTILLYPILGLSSGSSIWLSGFSAFGEYFYHMNIKTPRILGYIFQRPQSHRIHHYQNKRATCKNYADLPIWDILNNTFDNPEHMDGPTGFDTDTEQRRLDMLMFKDVLHKKKFNHPNIKYTILSTLLICIGCLHMVGYLLNSTQIRGIAFATGASPLPLVFSGYNGVETFSTTYSIDINMQNNTSVHITDMNKLYSQIKGPYNRRNVYGVVFTHGPFFQTPELINLRQHVLHHAVCKNGLNLDLFDVKNVTINIQSKTVGKENKHWKMFVTCDKHIAQGALSSR